MVLTVKELCLIALLSGLEFVVFTSFSGILYLECITFTIVLFALCFKPKVVILSSIVFPLINLSLMGITPWSLLYLLIYPMYSLVVIGLKPLINDRPVVIALVCGICSFLTGQILQLPYLLVSKKITYLYILVGLKTSLIQGIISSILMYFGYPPLAKHLRRLGRNM